MKDIGFVVESTTDVQEACAAGYNQGYEDGKKAVNHPAHYCEGRQYEPKDVIRDWDLNFNLGSAVKYISRAGRKDNTIRDLKKAVQFIEFEIEFLEMYDE